MNVGLRNEDDRLKSRSENRQIDIQRKHNDDVTTLKERYQREERQLVEMAEKDRKNESDASSDTLRHMRQVEDKQTRSVIIIPTTMLIQRLHYPTLCMYISELLGHQHDVYNETAKRLKEEIDELQERQVCTLCVYTYTYLCMHVFMYEFVY